MYIATKYHHPDVYWAIYYWQYWRPNKLLVYKRVRWKIIEHCLFVRYLHTSPIVQSSFCSSDICDVCYMFWPLMSTVTMFTKSNTVCLLVQGKFHLWHPRSNIVFTRFNWFVDLEWPLVNVVVICLPPIASYISSIQISIFWITLINKSVTVIFWFLFWPQVNHYFHGSQKGSNRSRSGEY